MPPHGPSPLPSSFSSSSPKISHSNPHPHPHPHPHHRTRTRTTTTTFTHKNDPPPPTRPTSINKLKAKIRDTHRLLNNHERFHNGKAKANQNDHSAFHSNGNVNQSDRDGGDHLPADIRIEKERALAAYRLDVAKIERERRRARMIRRYRMVRFFERQKATRHLKQLQKRLDACVTAAAAVAENNRGDGDGEAHEKGNQEEEEEEEEALREACRRAEIDVMYTRYFPLDEKYQSLYPNSAKNATSPRYQQSQQKKQKNKEEGMKETPEAAAESIDGAALPANAEKPTLWAVVAECMERGDLEDLREGRLRTRTRTRGKRKEDGHEDGDQVVVSPIPPNQNTTGKPKITLQPRAEKGGVLIEKERSRIDNKNKDKNKNKNKNLGSGSGFGSGSDESEGGFFEE